MSLLNSNIYKPLNQEIYTETVSLEKVNGKCDGVWFDLGLGTVWNRHTGQYFELVRDRDGNPVCYKELSGTARSCIEAEAY